MNPYPTPADVPVRAILCLRWACYGLLVFAAVWWTAVLPGFDRAASLLIDVTVWPLDGGHATLSPDVRFFSAIGAGLLVGLAIFLLLVVIPEVARGNLRVLRGAVSAVLGWWVVDSLGSWLAGVPENVVFNTITLAMLWLPMHWAGRGNGIVPNAVESSA